MWSDVSVNKCRWTNVGGYIEMLKDTVENNFVESKGIVIGKGVFEDNWGSFKTRFPTTADNSIKSAVT